jgi:hypothetical protein
MTTLQERLRTDSGKGRWQLQAERRKAANAIDELVEALKFYADEHGDGYDVTVTDYGLSLDRGEIIKDGGKRAEALVAKYKAKP